MSECCYEFSTGSKFHGLFAKSIIFIDRGSLYPAVSSVTYFSGAFPEEVLRQRVEELLAANPWLGSSVQKDPATGETALWVSGKPVVGKFFEIVHRKDE